MSVRAQQSGDGTTFPYNGVQDTRHTAYALTHAKIYSTAQQILNNATLLVKNGKIENIAIDGIVPKGYVEINCAGKIIYPSFIELIGNYGVVQPKGEQPEYEDDDDSFKPQFLSKKAGAYHWNETIHPETQSYLLFKNDPKTAEQWRKAGFGAVLSHLQDGVVRGTGVLVTPNDTRENFNILRERAAAFYSFSKGTSSQNYPSSLMGAIALLRQTYYDAQWYRSATHREANISLDYFNQNMALPQIFDANHKYHILRADKIGDEFGVSYIIKGGGNEYQNIDAIKATGASLILPLYFPKPYDVEDPLDANLVEFEQMKHWELAPYNPAKVAAAGITFALSTDGLKDKEEFWKNLRLAIKKGLSPQAALQALTATPAALLGMSQQLGTLEKGKIANFFIADTDIFTKGEILENWIQGDRFIISNKENTNKDGVYHLTMNHDRRVYEIHLSNTEKAAPKAYILSNDTTRTDVNIAFPQAQEIQLSFVLPQQKNAVRLIGWQQEKDMWKGKGNNAQGDWIDWTLQYKNPLALKTDSLANKENAKEAAADSLQQQETAGAILHPFLPFGWSEAPQQETFLFKNATVWTNEAEGILQNTDVWIEKGKIVKVGKELAVPAGTRIVDATGKHLTAGIIDEHSHIAIHRGVNESTQASSAEVRIGDVINADDINIYRQLAGGVTAAQLLHGSSNPIGGQSALIKLRWGYAPEQMKFEGAAPFIKFALGENVKQSNWGDGQVERFPQTRMGVEQVFMDYFSRARAYEQNRKQPNFRKDLELETLSEILQKKRFITCHSYVQSEINMLMKVAEHFDFTLNTFTHILEGYKVADKMKAHGANASSFADWWAYKMEVAEAIPHNGAILHDMGINVAFNSDDPEMARRLNTEAAKAVKYGGVTEEEAWKFVTLNPAKMLHVEQRTGSIKSGKDADVVLWSEHPLSVYAKAEMTLVDGICFFDIKKDEVLRRDIAAERNRLIQKMLQAKKGGESTEKPAPAEPHHYHCDDIKDEGR